MQKMKFSLVNRVIKEQLTSMEYNLIFYLVKICNHKGECVGVYYQVITQELSCSKATFYQIRDSLTEKGFITWQKNHSADIDIQLTGNDFTENGEIVYKDYLNTNISILNDKSFYSLRVGAKQLVLELLKRGAAGKKNKLWYIPFNQYKRFAEILRVSLRIVKEYFADIKRWIQVGHAVKDGKEYDIITILKRAIKEPQYIVSCKGKAKSVQAYPEYMEHKHYIQTQCRRNHIQANEIQLADTATLIQQYKKKAKALGNNIYNMVLRAIKNVNSMELNSISVHKILQNMIRFNKEIELDS